MCEATRMAVRLLYYLYTLFLVVLLYDCCTLYEVSKVKSGVKVVFYKTWMLCLCFKRDPFSNFANLQGNCTEQRISNVQILNWPGEAQQELPWPVADCLSVAWRGEVCIATILTTGRLE